MNKHQKALDFFRKHICGNGEKCEDCDINNSCDFQINIEKNYKYLKELVERATPKKPHIGYVIDGTYCFCRKCGHLIIELKMINSVNGDMFKRDNSFCSRCGCAIDWGDEE